jgi:hypothetical protein
VMSTSFASNERSAASIILWSSASTMRMLMGGAPVAGC